MRTGTAPSASAPRPPKASVHEGSEGLGASYEAQQNCSGENGEYGGCQGADPCTPEPGDFDPLQPSPPAARGPTQRRRRHPPPGSRAPLARAAAFPGRTRRARGRVRRSRAPGERPGSTAQRRSGFRLIPRARGESRGTSTRSGARPGDRYSNPAQRGERLHGLKLARELQDERFVPIVHRVCPESKARNAR